MSPIRLQLLKKPGFGFYRRSLLLALCAAMLATVLAFVVVRNSAQSTDANPIIPAASTITVNTTTDIVNSTDGLCTLREAILSANTDAASGPVAGECAAGNGDDIINFSVTGTINLTSALADISSNISLNGPGASMLTIQRSTAPGTPDFDVFKINGSGKVSVSFTKMTISNGMRGINNFAGSPLNVTECILSGNNLGGGIQNTVNSGSSGNVMNVTSCTISSNSAGPGDGSGGGISNLMGTVTVLNSTINGNSVGNGNLGAAGGGIVNVKGTLNVINSTISNNVTGFADSPGGGINSDGTLNVINSTIYNNSSQYGGGIYSKGVVTRIIASTISHNAVQPNSFGIGGTGGGIYNDFGTPLLLRNSIIALNTGDSPDLFNRVGSPTSQGHNLIGEYDGTGLVNGVNGDQVGTHAAPLDPKLGTLANNGGLTQTLALLSGSPAIDAGDNCITQVTHCGDPDTPQLITDQRSGGFNRTVDGNGDGTVVVDVGAYEKGAGGTLTPTSTVVTSSSNPSDQGESVTFAATVSCFGCAPTGSVQFKIDGSNFGSPVVVSGTGIAQLTTSSLAAGSHTISADYSGDSNYSASTGGLSGGQVVRSQPTLSIDDVGTFEGDSGTHLLNFTVTLSAASHLPVKVDYATTDGTATAPSDYVAIPTTTLTFNPGETTKLISVTVNGDQVFEPDEVFFVNLSNPLNVSISKTQGRGTIANDDPKGGIISFSLSNYNVSESGGFVTITVNRTGDISNSATVDYATDDTGAPASCTTVNGRASARCDFTSAAGTLHFAAGDDAKTFRVLVTQDAYNEGPEMLSLTLSNLTGGAVFASPSQATVTINDPSSPPATNPIDDPDKFVRQHYHDFLNREADALGLSFWTGEITSCGADAQCIQIKRINVSAAFFVSIEFQQTGYLVERIYKSSFGDAVGNSTLNNSHTIAVPIIRLNEFLRDTQQIGDGVVVGQTGWENQLESNKQAFTLDFVQRSRFASAYPISMTPAQFVDKLFLNAGVTPSTTDRNAAIGEFGTATDTSNLAARSRALRRVAENSTLTTNEFNRAFVLMQYFGYLRRNPNDLPDSDYTGYDFWLTKLNQFNGDYIRAEMVKAFIGAAEYRQRFGP